MPLRLPDFLVGGAPRSGTTWLYTALDRHPDIYMARPAKPEPKFFLVDEVYDRGLEHYSKTWFSDVPPGRIAGEKSTDYLESAAAAERISRDLPGVRLVFILRDPIDRAYSNYLWTRMNGLEHEDFETALRLEEERERTLPKGLMFTRPFAYFSRGVYADLLRVYFGRFPVERILVLKFEDIISAPAELIASAHRFLGVEERRADVQGLGVVNPADRSGRDLIPEHVRQRLSERYRQPNERLAALLGSSFSMWR